MQKINFLRGVPADEALVPIAGIFAENFATIFKEYGGPVLQYQTPGLSDFLGFIPLKKSLAQRYKVSGDVNKRVICTNGGMETLTFILKSFPPGSGIASDALTYDRFILDVIKLGHRSIGVPLTHDGVDLTELEKTISENDVKVYYQVGYHQSPMGFTTSNANLEAASEICAKHNVLHVIDIAYFELRFDGAKNILIDLSKFPETTCLAGSFTKTISPGAKCGFGILPESVVALITPVITNSRLNPNYPTQAAIHKLIDSGYYDKHLKFLIDLYKPRMEAMNNAFKKYLPDIEVAELAGGFFLGLSLPGVTNEAGYIERIGAKGVTLSAPTAFTPGWKEKYYKKTGGIFFRLTFPAFTPEENDLGIARIAETYKEML